MTEYAYGSITSADGTVIAHRRLGSGPSLVLMHGGMQASQHLMKLAGMLSADFTVYVPDRRGRGRSGAHGPDFGIAREVEDLQALIHATDATQVFGLSSGALITLRTALFTPALTRIALYEPPMSIHGSAPVDWLPRYDREVARGKIASALITALKGMGTEPTFGRIPRFLLVPFISIIGRMQRSASGDDVAIMDLVPTQHYDFRMVREMADTAPDYAALNTEVLLLGGAKSPVYLDVALNALAATLPQARRVIYPDLGHSGPDDDGKPELVGAALNDFFHGVTV